MPRIEIYDASNTPYRIDTFDWQMIRKWLAEWAPRLHDPDYPLRMSVRPLFTVDGSVSVPDWNADTRFFEWFQVPWDPDLIMERIGQIREAIEQAKAQGRNQL